MWTTKWLTNEEKNVEYEKIRNSQSVLFKDFMDACADPRPGSNRKGIE